MIYEQFIVSIVEQIILSWQQILLHNFHSKRVIWLFLFKLRVHNLHGLENIWISNIWKLWLVYVTQGGNFLMSGIQVCATDQGRFFTSKNPEQAPNFGIFTPEQALPFEVLLQNKILFWQSGVQCLAQMSKILISFVFCFLQPDIFIFVLQSISSFL